MSNVTSFSGIPRGACGISVTGNVQESCYPPPLGVHLEERGYQQLVGCLLQLRRLVGFRSWIVVLRSMSFVKTPLFRYQVTMVTSRRTTSLTSPVITIHLDGSTHSNNFIRVYWFVLVLLPVSANSFNNGRDGRVEPLTRMTSSISDKLKPASERLDELGLCTFYKVTSQIVECSTSQSHFKWEGPAFTRW